MEYKKLSPLDKWDWHFARTGNRAIPLNPSDIMTLTSTVYIEDFTHCSHCTCNEIYPDENFLHPNQCPHEDCYGNKAHWT